jgi:hypothetical protein
MVESVTSEKFMSSTTRMLLDFEKQVVPHVSNADAARAAISRIQFAKAIDTLQTSSDNINKAEVANTHYLTLTQDQVLGGQFARTIANLKQKHEQLVKEQDKLTKELVNTWNQVETIHVQTLKQLEEAFLKNLAVHKLRESSTIHKQYQDIKNLKDPLLTKIDNWKKSYDELQNEIATVYADILSRLPDREKTDTRKFPPPVYVDVTDTKRLSGGKF